MNTLALWLLTLCLINQPIAARETFEMNFYEEGDAEIMVDDADDEIADDSDEHYYSENDSDEDEVTPSPTFQQPVIQEQPIATACKKETNPCTPRPNWYFEVKPGYYYFTDSQMREFFGSGGFTIRGEAGYRLWGPLALWFDGSYFHKDGHALGGSEETKLLLATLSLGLKMVWYPHDRFAFYLGGAPRLFLMMLDNDYPYVRSNDNEIGIGAGFQGGFWLFPIPSWKNFFLDLFADYSWKTMEVEPDEISSDDYNVNISGLSFGIGVGVRF